MVKERSTFLPTILSPSTPLPHSRDAPPRCHEKFVVQVGLWVRVRVRADFRGGRTGGENSWASAGRVPSRRGVSGSEDRDHHGSQIEARESPETVEMALQHDR